MSENLAAKIPMEYIAEEMAEFKGKYGRDPGIVIFNDILKDSFSNISLILGMEVRFSPALEKIELCRLF